MKHLQLFEHYTENIVEGVNYNGASDADLVLVGHSLSDDKLNKDIKDEELAALAVAGLKKAKPISLTGKIKEDAPKLIKYIVDAFKRTGVELDGSNATISNDFNLDNAIQIPVSVDKDLFFLTYLDYEEIANDSKKMLIGGSFSSEDEGNLDYVINDLNDNGQIVKAGTEFKKYLETKNSEK